MEKKEKKTWNPNPYVLLLIIILICSVATWIVPAGSFERVYDEELVEPLAKVLFNLGVNNAMVVYGQDKIDEISMSAPTTVCEVRNGHYTSYEIKPEDFGFTRCDKKDIEGGTPQENAAYALEILKGAKGPKTDAVLINAGAAIHIAKPDVSISEGIKIARETLESGKALKQLEEFVKFSNM